MTVVLLRLVNGNEIMGDMLSDSKESISLKNPMIVDEVDTEGQGFIVLQNYVPFREESFVKFNKIHVIDFHEVHPYIRNFYEISVKYSQKIEKSRLTDIRKTNEYMIEKMMNDMDESYEDSPFFIKGEKPNILN